MADRQAIQAKMEATLAKGEEKVAALKVQLGEAGEKASQESKDALAAAERALDSGRQKMGELADASDEKFDEVMAKTKDTWDDLSDQVESGWASVTDKIKGMFS
jgi:hypothetical protein